MNLKPLTTDLSVTPQIEPSEIAELAARGFKSIIGNRPEEETSDQPTWSSLAAQAEQHGLAALHIPVTVGQIGAEDIERFAQALRDLPKPIAAFCRTGTRAAMLWALANPQGQTADERIRIAADQGFDLESLRVRLER